MTSQVPTTNNTYISDIAFDSNYPYSIHPTATNDSINVGDIYWYNSGVTLSFAGGCYDYIAEACGPLAFDVNSALTNTYIFLGSSGYL